MSKPSFTLTYWRPWEKSSSFVDSWLNYNKDVSLVEYGAEVIGSAINQLSQDQISSINNLSQSVNDGYNLIEQGLHTINRAIEVTNYKLDILIQTQVANHVVLKDIQELLKVPDREKERIHHIENALKYIKHVGTNKDFYKDAYTEFKKAKALKTQDYFTLFNLGMIELYSPSHINVASAKKHFDNAIKYASIDKENNEFQYLNSLFSKYSGQTSDCENSKFLHNCYINSAICSYIMGKDIDAYNKIAEVFQTKDNGDSNDKELTYYLAKFGSRLGDSDEIFPFIDECLESNITFLQRMVNDFDFTNNNFVRKHLSDFIEGINDRFDNFKKVYKSKRDFLIYKNINDSLSWVNNNFYSKYRFLDFYFEEYIKEEIEKELQNKKIEEDIKVKLIELNTVEEKLYSYNNLIATSTNKVDYHEAQSKNLTESTYGALLTLGILSFIFSVVYFSCKYYDSYKGDSLIITLLINPIVAIPVSFFIGLGVAFFYRGFMEEHHKQEYESVSSDISALTSERDHIFRNYKRIQNSIHTLESKKHNLNYSIKNFN